MMRRAISLVSLSLLASLPVGCASQRVVAPAEPPLEALSDPYQPQARQHTVQAGETLFHIAHLYGIDVHILQAQNQIARPEDLRVGQVLVITPPARGSAAPSVASVGSAVGPLAWPVRGLLVSRFGTRGGEHHDGIDIAAPEGSPVAAAAPGVVIFSGEQRGYGNLAVIDHGRGEATVYAHCEKVLVTQGQPVTRGQIIARVGRTGHATGPHLHFEVREHAQPRDPLGYFERQ
jgi:murein DD-endopeptidase MepM/ murein hydrolase activator NlpD